MTSNVTVTEGIPEAYFLLDIFLVLDERIDSMYITVLDKHNTKQPRSLVDCLFDDTLEEYTNDKVLIRTKTYNQNTCESNITPIEKMLVFCRHVLNVISKHENVEEEYTQFKIPKKTHGFREINAPKPELKTDMKDIAEALTGFLKIQVHDSAWAYVKGRDVVKAVQEHIDNDSRWYLKLDLHNFFGSCTENFIIDRLLNIYPFAKYKSNDLVKETVEAIAKFATLNGGLPQGTPLSPVLTNLIMVDFDYNLNKKIAELSKEHKVYKQRYIYTRYADDILISAKYDFDFNVIVQAVKDLLQDTPLELNIEKTRYGSNAGRNWNLGIMCNKDNKTTVGYRRKQKLKTVIHNYMTYKNEWSLEDLRWLLGNLSWLRNVEPDYFKGLMLYYKNKYSIDIWTSLITDIKHYNN